MKKCQEAIAVIIIIITLLPGFAYGQSQENSESDSESNLHFQTKKTLKSHFVGSQIEKKFVVTGGSPLYAYVIQDGI